MAVAISEEIYCNKEKWKWSYEMNRRIIRLSEIYGWYSEGFDTRI